MCTPAGTFIGFLSFYVAALRVLGAPRVATMESQLHVVDAAYQPPSQSTMGALSGELVNFVFTIFCVAHNLAHPVEQPAG